jgi:hypothetical protein
MDEMIHRPADPKAAEHSAQHLAEEPVTILGSADPRNEGPWPASGLERAEPLVEALEGARGRLVRLGHGEIQVTAGGLF